MWFGRLSPVLRRAAFSPSSLGFEILSQRAKKNGWVFWLYANDQAERVALSASGVRWMSVNLSVRAKKDFPPQSFSSGHTKGLPIGIILSFVLLTSMKLPSLVFFFFSFNFFHAFVLLRFGGCGLPSEGFIELRACPPLCHEMVEFQAKPRLIFCTRRKETVVAFLASQYFWNHVYSWGY